MSGIMAILSLDGRPIPQDLPRAQLAAIAHRGEWEPKLWEGPGIALGHVNLPRTPEAEREFLPAADPTGRYWITWDGRLDNRDELAGLLDLDAVQRREMTDADYVLAAYTKWRDDCVHHLLGDWAVVIWDSHERRLFCAKDPLGWRQLYYAEHEGILAVGSEPQQFFANGWLPRAANEDFVMRTLAQAVVTKNSSCWLGVSEVRGGESVQYETESVRLGVHTPYPLIRKRNYRDPLAYVDEFEDLVRKATMARLRSNVPVGTLLSGGLDSSYTTAVAASVQPGLPSFTIYAPNTRDLDERKYARLVTERIGSELTEVNASDCWYMSSKWLPDSAIDQPIIPGAGPSLRKVTRHARSTGVGVLIGGEGGDEWLGGSWSPAALPAVASAILARRVRTARDIVGRRRGRASFARAVAVSLVDGFTPAVMQSALQPFRRSEPVSLARFVTPETGWTPLAAAGFARPWDLEGRARGTFAIYRQVVANEVAWRDRHVFLGCGIELRSPLNDWRVVELLASTPDWVKQFTGEYRAILRVALRRAGLGDIAARRTKGTYAELARIGMIEQEHCRLALGLRTVSTIPGVRGAAIQTEAARWKASDEASNGDLVRLATTGIWLSHLHSQAEQPRLRAKLKERGGDSNAEEV